MLLILRDQILWRDMDVAKASETDQYFTKTANGIGTSCLRKGTQGHGH